MVARYSDATKLKHAKFLAKQGRCFIVEKVEQVRNKLGQMINQKVWLLYREGEPRNVFIAKRSSIAGIYSAVVKATAHE